jgi:hypothetical protein
MGTTTEKTQAQKSADKLYDQFYSTIPTRVMHFFEHQKLAAILALTSVRDKIKTLEGICEGMMSRTCRIGSDPSEVLAYWREVETCLIEKQKEILKGAKAEGYNLGD